MPLLQLLPVVSAYLYIAAYARPITFLSEREDLTSSPIKSHSLSAEAIVGVIAIAVAIFGIALPFIWPSLRARLDSRLHFRSSPSSTCMFFPQSYKTRHNINEA